MRGFLLLTKEEYWKERSVIRFVGVCVFFFLVVQFPFSIIDIRQSLRSSNPYLCTIVLQTTSFTYQINNGKYKLIVDISGLLTLLSGILSHSL